MFRYAKAQCETEEHAIGYYFYSAEFLLSNLLKLLQELGVDPGQESILDFACGYGRFTRYFTSKFKLVVASDLDQEMLSFNSSQFGCATFLSALDCEMVKVHRNKYGIVFCFSLFTHLNQDIWGVWFRVLFDLVEKGGLFIISAHSYKLFKALNHIQAVTLYERAGENFVFWADNETGGRLDPNYYGCNIIDTTFITEQCRALNNISLVKHYEMGEFDLYHDIYVFQKVDVA
jgi:SAM-dependent methyltransferase